MADESSDVQHGRIGMHLTQSELVAYAGSLATIIVETETVRLTFACRMEVRDGAHWLVLDDANAHDYEMLRGLHEQTITSTEQLARARLAAELCAGLGEQLRPTTTKPAPPWERFPSVDLPKGP
jgi:hypothetical protein